MYKHDFAIRHLPKFWFGIVLLIITTLAVALNLYSMTSVGWVYNPGQVLMTLINCVGMMLGTSLVFDSVKYTATEIPEEDLDPDEKLKRDLK